ncbi:uncharacterized protein LOC119250698 isoform X7 [Talpa occidentalis]|uniref:uncharacterized protein LOC119250698 isoform X7 n=1 Tax=Talpa occidentalis TaxID=50954 RepID=UPI0023F65A0D|nr:uncharacterized protein LOC119250698 isoform X7 [Talpa occidentalis]
MGQSLGTVLPILRRASGRSRDYSRGLWTIPQTRTCQILCDKGTFLELNTKGSTESERHGPAALHTLRVTSGAHL